MQLTTNEWMQKAGELEAEVERLRRLLNNVANDAGKAEAELKRLRLREGALLNVREENERLRSNQRNLQGVNKKLRTALNKAGD